MKVFINVLPGPEPSPPPTPAPTPPPTPAPTPACLSYGEDCLSYAELIQVRSPRDRTMKNFSHQKSVKILSNLRHFR